MACGCGNVPCRHIVITNNDNCGDESVTVTQPLIGTVKVTAIGPQGPTGASGTSGTSGTSATLGLGWARYDDNQYTTSSFLTITDGSTITIPNNGSYTEETYMNSTVDFYNPLTQKVQMENVGDVYSMIIVFQAKAPNANQTHMDISLTATGATPYDRVSKTLLFGKGNNIWENIYESFHFYSDSDFVTNGNQWKITASGGSVDIANVIYFIQRTFNPGS